MTDELNPQYHELIYNSLKAFGWFILLVCTFVHSAAIKLDKNKLMAVCFVLNILLSLPSFAVSNNRYGIDTTAYIN